MSYIRYDAHFLLPNPLHRSHAARVMTPAFSPLYQQIKGLILRSFQTGEWKPGDLIPSEIELAARFKVSQGTVRKAVDELAQENLVIRRQGKGTFVATHTEQQVRYRFLKLHPDIPGQQDAGRSRRNVMDCRRVRSTADVARALQLRSGDAVMQVRRVLSFDGRATILEDLWLPGQAFRRLTAQQMASHDGPTYALFENEFGVRMVRAEEKIRAVLPDASQAELLNVTPSTPLLSVERIAFTYNDIPMELRRGLYRTDSHHYRNTLS